MKHLEAIRKAVGIRPAGENIATDLIRYRSLRKNFDKTPLMAKALAQKEWFERFPTSVYDCDRIAGNRRGNFVTEYDETELRAARKTLASYGSLHFGTNSDHFAPAYGRFLADGIRGTLARIDASLDAHRDDAAKTEFLTAQRLVTEGFQTFVGRYAEAAREVAAKTDSDEYRRELERLAADLCAVVSEPPVTLRQALNLVWLIHLSFTFQGKYAMALGRLDQYLLPYYRHDIEAGILTPEDAEDLFASVFIKLTESRWTGGDDVVNICIGGVTPDGQEGVNELSYRILHAVRDCNVPGPNLSARLHEGIPDEFIDECLRVIGTGLGYPALMNDRVNIPALARHGYRPEHARDYCFVGCIENFIPGRQPAWSDGRFNMPKFLEAVFFRGKSMSDDTYLGLDTGPLEDLVTMEDFLGAYEQQVAYAASEYTAEFNNMNSGINYRNYAEPWMSVFCEDCIARGMDINAGGALYPSAHGACMMGIATVADSLAAIEKNVYLDKTCTLAELRDAMAADFAGYERLRAKLAAAPKYGNDDPFVDKYAVWFVEFTDAVFSQYHTRDGGPFYTAIASNTASVYCGKSTGATPDGRHAGAPLSDAASPTYGMDREGPTAAFLSLSKPDYRLVSCGTVVNQKYTPDMLTDPVKRDALLSAIKVYFHRGGQEVQINCVSRETLMDAMEHPENYLDLVVRVSGFSAYFVSLDRAVQEDILHRTEHAEI